MVSHFHYCLIYKLSFIISVPVWYLIFFVSLARFRGVSPRRHTSSHVCPGCFQVVLMEERRPILDEGGITQWTGVWDWIERKKGESELLSAFVCFLIMWYDSLPHIPTAMPPTVIDFIPSNKVLPPFRCLLVRYFVIVGPTVTNRVCVGEQMPWVPLPWPQCHPP